jgi:hypothetical protein
MGPLSSKNGVIGFVVTCMSQWKALIRQTSSAAMSTGMYSGRQPAMTAFTARTLTLACPWRGGMMPMISSAGRPVAR